MNVKIQGSEELTILILEIKSLKSEGNSVLVSSSVGEDRDPT